MLKVDNPNQRHSSGERLYAEFRSPLLRFFTRRVRNPADAEDLTQEVFARLLRKADGADVDNLHGFVFQIAINLLRDRARRAQVRNEAKFFDIESRPIHELTAELVEDRDPERVLLAKEGVAQVVHALNELNERTRDIYVLFRLENMKQRDIAALYGIGQSTVEKEVMRATMHLATRFEPMNR